VWRSVLGPVLRKTRFQVSLSGGKKKTLSPHRQNSILGDTTISESRWPCGGLRAAAFRKTKNLRTGHFRQWGGVAGITIGGGSRKGSTSYSGRGEAGVALRRWSEGPARATEECESRTAGLEARCKGQSGNAVRRAGSVQSMKTLKAVATRDQGQSMQGPQPGPGCEWSRRGPSGRQRTRFLEGLQFGKCDTRPIDARAPSQGPDGVETHTAVRHPAVYKPKASKTLPFGRHHGHLAWPWTSRETGLVWICRADEARM
jgi:hypothetical protein